MRQLRVGVVDVGSNSVRLIVAEREERGYRVLLHRAEILKLILSLTSRGFPEEVEDRLSDLLRDMIRQGKELGAERFVIIATEAFRRLPEAYRRELLRRLRESLSEEAEALRLEVLTESEEARYAFIALMDLADSISAIVDIGGGSTDVTLPYLSAYQSLKLGLWRARELLEHKGEHAIKDELLTLLSLSGLYHVLLRADKPLIFLGGTPVLIAQLILKPQDLSSFYSEAAHQVSSGALRALYEEFKALSDEKISELIPVPSRAPTLKPALLIMLTLAEISGTEKVLISPKSIVDGVLREEFARGELTLKPVILSMLCTHDSITDVRKFMRRVLTSFTSSDNYTLVLYDPIEMALSTIKEGEPSSYKVPILSLHFNEVLSLPFSLELTPEWRELISRAIPVGKLRVDLSKYRTLLKLDLGNNFLGLLLLEDSLRELDLQLLFIAKQLISNYLMMGALYRASMIDPLTNIYNRRYLFDKLNEELKRAVRYRLPLSIVIMDIDNFKGINDQYGHTVGDQALREVSRYIVERTRRGVDVVARYGGDEFMLLLPHTPAEGALHCCLRLASEIASIKFTQLKLRLRTSWGIAEYYPEGEFNFKVQPDYEELKRELISKADAAMYEAKRSNSWEPLNKVYAWEDSENKPLPFPLFLARNRRGSEGSWQRTRERIRD